MLDVWPALPIAVEFRRTVSRLRVSSNLTTALNQRDRIRKIDLSHIPDWQLIQISEIKEPLPMLTDLKLASNYDTKLLLPDSFLGGSAPRLRSLYLIGTPFPALPKLLLSAAELVTLYISMIPHSSHTSPDTIVTSLSTLTRLQNLSLGFPYSRSPADNTGRLLPPLTRVVLPALTSLHFLDYYEYMEDIVSRIDTPLLENMTIRAFTLQIFDTDTRHLRYFISHTEAFKPLQRADIDIADYSVSLTVFSRGAVADHEFLKFTSLPLVLSGFAQFCISALPSSRRTESQSTLTSPKMLSTFSSKPRSTVTTTNSGVGPSPNQLHRLIPKTATYRSNTILLHRNVELIVLLHWMPQYHTESKTLHSTKT